MGLTTRKHLWVILCPEKVRKREEIVEKMKVTDRGENEWKRGNGRNNEISPHPYLLLKQRGLVKL